MKAICVVSFVLALILGAGLLVHAGGKGALKVDLRVGQVNPLNNRVEPVGPQVGFAVFNATANGRMNVTVKVDGGAANTTFTVRLVPTAWGSLNTASTQMTTNAEGQGAIQLQVDVPDPPSSVHGPDDTLRVKMTLRSAGDAVTYATFLHLVPAK